MSWFNPNTVLQFSMEIKWPTLEGRLSQPIASELEALEQLAKSVELTELAKKKLKKLRKGLTNPKRRV